MSVNSALSEIHMQIMWNRLIAVVEEQAQTLIRTAFSNTVREAGDLSAGVFDMDGRMLAQAVTGTPGHVNAMAASVNFFLEQFPAETMKEGDVFITNDPWKGTGHLHDLTVVTPTFKDGGMVALFACTSHVVDVGGLGFGPDGRQVFEEGLYIPLMYLAREGVMNEDLLEMVRWNVREPVQVEGDIYSLAACNEVGGRRLVDMMAEFDLDDLDELGEYVIENSRRAMLEEIRKLPFGTYENAMRIDGYNDALDLVAKMTIQEDGIDIDFTGTSGVSEYGINVPHTYTEAYASFGVRCVVGSTVPNNAGSLAPVRVQAPEGTILNAKFPAGVAARHAIGQMLPDVMLGCLHKAVDGIAPAEGTSCLWNPVLYGGPGVAGRIDDGVDATTFTVTLFHNGGTGARPQKDGLSATAFPSGVRNTPVEINEAISPIVIWKKEYRTDSAGAGTHRGGVGQVMEITNQEHAPFVMSSMFDRVGHPPRGRNGGGNGQNGRVYAASGIEMKAKGRQRVAAGDRLVLEMPGGGGYGDPKTRDPELVALDVRDGLVSADAAARDYGVVLAADGSVDTAATTEARAG
ncbi:MAG: hydantoinase B/oxoprolinase family protein [Alphaproteobacteria bacterium]|jgi:N-methylhydantoinase B|nr:hydantoinase B/oxoprolinase family protein [Alphaproteobacteria bacterium]